MRKDYIGASINQNFASETGMIKQASGYFALVLQVTMPCEPSHPGQGSNYAGPVARDSDDLRSEKLGLRTSDRTADPWPKLAPGRAQGTMAPIKDEVDDGAVVAIVTYREVNPVLVLTTDDDDLVAAGITHDCGVAGTFSAINTIAFASSVFGQVDDGLESLQLIALVQCCPLDFDGAVADAWKAEAESRIDAYEAGRASADSAEAVFARISKR